MSRDNKGFELKKALQELAGLKDAWQCKNDDLRDNHLELDHYGVKQAKEQLGTIAKEIKRLENKINKLKKEL